MYGTARALAALVWAASCLAPSSASAPETLPLRRYSVDLDAPAGERWSQILEDFLDRHGADAFEETYTAWTEGLAAMLPDDFGPGLARRSAERFADALKQGHPELMAELDTLSGALRRRKLTPVFDVPMLAAATAIYVLANTSPKNVSDDPYREDEARSFGSACTSTVVIGEDGHVLHGRSLDYEPRGAIARSVVEVDFLRKGQYQYTCMHPLVYPTQFQWYTCVKPGSFSLSVNARSQGWWTEHNTTFAAMTNTLRTTSKMLLGEVASAAMDAASYAGALATLASKPVVSSNYFILAGASAGDGAIVTRYGNASSADVWPLGGGLADGQPSWMRVQTNVDHWVPIGAYATIRRQHAINLLQKAGEGAEGERHVSEASLWDAYLTDSALDEESLALRRHPEDTGAILRPTTIASLVMRPATAAQEGGTNTSSRLHARVWAADPSIRPPATPSVPTSAPLVV